MPSATDHEDAGPGQLYCAKQAVRQSILSSPGDTAREFFFLGKTIRLSPFSPDILIRTRGVVSWVVESLRVVLIDVSKSSNHYSLVCKF